MSESDPELITTARKFVDSVCNIEFEYERIGGAVLDYSDALMPHKDEWLWPVKPTVIEANLSLGKEVLHSLVHIGIAIPTTLSQRRKLAKLTGIENITKTNAETILLEDS